MNKKFLSFTIFTFLLVGLYNVLLFVLKEDFNKNSWICYAFIMFAFVLCYVSFVIANNKINYQKVTGVPITVLSAMYVVVEFVLGTVFMLISKASFNLVFLTQLIVLVLTLAIYIPSLLTYYVESTSKNTPEQK